MQLRVFLGFDKAHEEIYTGGIDDEYNAEPLRRSGVQNKKDEALKFFNIGNDKIALKLILKWLLKCGAFVIPLKFASAVKA